MAQIELRWSMRASIPTSHRQGYHDLMQCHPTLSGPSSAGNPPHRWLGLVLCTAIMLAPGMVKADAVSDFFKGKVVRMVVAYPPGGGYDVYARLMAQFAQRHLPGNPTVVVQNMPGAGSL